MTLYSPHPIKGRGGVGGYGDRKVEHKGLKRKTRLGAKRPTLSKAEVLKAGRKVARLKPVSDNRRRLTVAYRLVKGFAEARLIHHYVVDLPGEIRVPCVCCGRLMLLFELDPDHIYGRHGENPGDLRRLIDPGNLQYVCRTCHNAITQSPIKIDFAAKNLPLWKADMLVLRSRVMARRPPGLGERQKWADSAQVIAVKAALKALEVTE